MPHKVTLRVIADAAGVCPSTVSLALRNSPQLPEETRARIRRTAKALGYRPDPQVRAWLAARRAPGSQSGETLVYLNPFPDEKTWRKSPSIVGFHEGARARADELGFRWETMWFRKSGWSQKRLDAILAARGIRGVIVGSFPQAYSHLRLRWDRYVAIAQGMTLLRPELPRACNNYYETLGTLLRNLSKRGYRRPGFFIDENFDKRCRRLWLASYLVHMHQRGGGRVPPCIVKLEVRAAFEKWLGAHRPDVVVASGLHVLGWLRELGWAVPREIGFASFNREPTEEWRDITGMNHQMQVCGAVAVDYLSGKLSRNEAGLGANPEMIMTPGEWVEGKTTRGW